MFSPENYPALKPMVSSWITEFLKNKNDIFSLTKAYGPSLDIHNPYLFLQNQAALSQTFEKFNLKYKMLFPRKASHCKRILQLAAGNGIGAVVSNTEELIQCLNEYNNTDQIMVSSEHLTEELIQLALNDNLIIMVDSVESCSLIQKISLELNKTAKIGIKLTNFENDDEDVQGFNPTEAYGLITEKFGNIWSQLLFCGFHFQMDDFCLYKRAEALRKTIVTAELLNREGVKTQYIDIGDTFPVNYIADQKDWGNFHKELKKAIHGQENLITRENLFLNSLWKDSLIKGEMKIYPYFNKYPKEEFLEKLMMLPFSHHELLFQAIRSRGIQILAQPGRALLDQTGITLAKITHIEYSANHEYKIGLQLNQDQLNRLKVDYLLDPIFLSKKEQSDANYATGYLIGNCGAEKEVLLKRKILIRKKPELNDVVCFVNTAGYALHLNEVHPSFYLDAKNIYISEKNNYWDYELVAS